MSQFTDKQHKAIDHFIVNRSKTDAYRHAYKCDKMKPATVNRRAFELFDLPKVKEAVAAALQKVRDKAVIDAAWVLKRASLLADFNIKRFIRVTEQGNAVYDFTAATDDDWYCISEYTVDVINKGCGDDVYEVERVKLKGFDKLKALELVGKHIDVSAFKEQVEHTGPNGGPIQVATLTQEQALELLKKNGLAS